VLRTLQLMIAFTTLMSVLAVQLNAEDWPQWRGPTRDGEWTETGLVTKFDAPRLARKWSVAVGPGYSGPTVSNGRVFITDRQSEPKQVERVHCFNESDGSSVWTHTYECPYVGIGYVAGPRASVTIDQDRAYALGSMGHIHCLATESGDVHWKRDLNKELPISMPNWGIAAAPLIYRDFVILHIGGADGACIVALDKMTGKEKWRALDEKASYSAPILIQQAGRPVVIAWTGESLSGLDADTGEVNWHIPFPPSRMPIGIATPIVEGNRIFVSSFYDGSLMVELAQDRPTARKLWAARGRDEMNTEALQTIISTPVMFGGHVYGVDSHGELRCLDGNTGKRIWEDLSATPRSRWSTIHFVRQHDRFWMFNERGELLIGRLSPQGFQEISRAKLLEPTREQLRMRGGVCWSHPAYANKHIFARNDKELVCASLAAE
jgi:outer membrane protein assembly factor BamB